MLGQKGIEDQVKSLLEEKSSKMEDVGEKTAVVEKVITERRIKKMYKDKYDGQYQNELDT